MRNGRGLRQRYRVQAISFTRCRCRFRPPELRLGVKDSSGWPDDRPTGGVVIDSVYSTPHTRVWHKPAPGVGEPPDVSCLLQVLPDGLRPRFINVGLRLENVDGIFATEVRSRDLRGGRAYASVTRTSPPINRRGTE